MSEKLIKSKKRVKDFAEVYTPAWIVSDMLDLIPSINVIDATVFEPSFGNGQFLVQIYERKLKNCKTANDVKRSVASVYGVELLKDNCTEAKKRLWDLLFNCGITLSTQDQIDIDFIMNLNLRQGNFLTQQKEDGTELHFVDWKHNEVFTLDDIIEKEQKS